MSDLIIVESPTKVKTIKRYLNGDYEVVASMGHLRDLPKSKLAVDIEHNFEPMYVNIKEKEYLIKPCSLEEDDRFSYYHMPVTGGGDTPKSPEAVATTYLGMLDDMMDTIIDTIMNAKSKVMYFCGAGKDRTGVVSAIILKKLGFDESVIIDDYMETKDNLMEFLKEYVNKHPEVDINIIIPNENNIKKVLEKIN